VPFVGVTALTDVSEGDIVRTITRLDETCRVVRNAARILGDPRLFRLADAASEAIKRDVVFAPSLWHTL
jgi:antiviral helicase SKI2